MKCIQFKIHNLTHVHQPNCYWCKWHADNDPVVFILHAAVFTYWIIYKFIDCICPQKVADAFSWLENFFYNSFIGLNVERLIKRDIQWPSYLSNLNLYDFFPSRIVSRTKLGPPPKLGYYFFLWLIQGNRKICDAECYH